MWWLFVLAFAGSVTAVMIVARRLTGSAFGGRRILDEEPKT